MLIGTATLLCLLACRFRSKMPCVSKLWGAFPFSVPFNVSGHPAIVLPAGLVDGLPVAIQLVAAANREQFLLDIAQELEEALALDFFNHDLPQRKANS